MDIARKGIAEKRKQKRMIFAFAGLVVLVAVTLGLSRLEPAKPTVERATVWIDVVKRGPMLRQVRGSGTLVPEEIQWIPAASEGRVEKILVPVGSAVETDTVLLELSNPELKVQARDAQLQLQASMAELSNERVRAESQIMDQEAVLAAVKASFLEAQLRAEADEELSKEGLVANITLKISKAKAEEFATRYEIEKKRLTINERSAQARLAVQKAKVDQIRAQYELRKELLEGLRVRSGARGVLQQLPVQVGQRVTPGTTLAKVAQPERLKAELKIAETQAKDIQIGLPASIDTRNGIVAGRVVRMDPAAQNGTVTVDVGITETLPKGARPDLTVDGTIELERIADVLFTGRPASGQEFSTLSLFRIGSDGKTAQRVQVKFGRSSVNLIEIVDGLKEGDRVILSDMSEWDEHDQIRLD